MTSPCSAGPRRMSARGAVVIRRSQMGGSLVIAQLVDLDLGCSEQCSDLDNLWRLLESVQLMSGHGKIGARCLLNVLVANAKKLLIKIANKRTRITSHIGQVGCIGSISFFLTTSLAVGVSGFTSPTLGAGLTVLSDAVVTDHEQFSTKEPRDGGVVDGGAGGTLRF